MRSKITLLATLFSFCLCGQISSQCTTLPTTLNKRVSESSVVVEGEVTRQHSFWDKGHKHIYTANTIEITQVFKGRISQESIDVITTGGTVGNNRLEVHPSLHLHIGDRGVFLFKDYQGSKILSGTETILRPVADQASMIAYSPDMSHAKDQGKTYDDIKNLHLTLEQITGNIAERKGQFPALPSSRMTPTITGFSQSTVTAGTATSITLSGTDFGTTQGNVFFDAADDGAGGSFVPAASSQISSWGNTSITVEIPEGAGTGNVIVINSEGVQSPQFGTLNVTYNIDNVNSGGVITETRLIDDKGDGDNGYEFFYMNNTANSGVDITSVTGATDAIERAISTWQSSTSAVPFYVSVSCGLTTVQDPDSNDGINIVGFDNDLHDLDIEASSSTLGVMYSSYSICGSSEWEVVDIDMILRRDGNPNGIGGSVSWNYGPGLPSGGQSDFESVILHEFGHGIRLGHIINSGGVMHFASLSGTSNRSLSASSDIAGTAYVMTNSKAYNPPIINCGGDFPLNRQVGDYLSSEDCALPVELLEFNASLVKDFVELDWATASEINSDVFDVEHSTDGNTFLRIGQVRAAGNSLEEKQYRFTHYTPSQGVNYYRLKQVDFDGIFEYFGPRKVQIINKGISSLYPIPSQNFITLEYSSLTSDNISWNIMDASGRILKNGNVQVESGLNQIEIQHLDLPSGVYIIQIHQNGFEEVRKFVISE